MSSRKHNLRNKSVLLSDIPILDLDGAEDDDIEIDLRNPYVGVSEEYLDHGDPTNICEACNAVLWDAEARMKRPYKGKWCYSLCCFYGKVQLPDLKDPPPMLLQLFRGNDSSTKNFLKNIRTYNMMFSFTSMGGKIDHSVNIGRGPYCFRLHGQNYQRLGSLLPVNDAKPKFSQLYVYDTDNEDQNRIDAVRSGSSNRKINGNSIDPQITEELRTILDGNNELVKSYRMVRDRYISQENQLDNVKLRLIGRRMSDGRTYNLPTASEIAVLIVGDIEEALDERDIVVESQTGDIQQINVLHPKFLSLQYPLLFPYGEDGYHTDILHRDVVDPDTNKHVRLTMHEFMAYIIQEMPHKFSLIHNSRRLFQQFLVDSFTMIETERMYFYRSKQKILRCASYENLSNQLGNGNQDASTIGKRIILPSSFTGGASCVYYRISEAWTSSQSYMFILAQR